MIIKVIKMSTIMGFESAEWELGGINIFEGGNGAGKSTIIEVMKSIVGGGTDATLIRKGHKSGEAVLVFDDKTSLIRRHGKTPPVTVKGPDGVKKPSPQTVVNALIDAMSCNPMKFVNGTPEEILKLILDTIPIEVEPADFAAAAGMDEEWAKTRIAEHASPLEAISVTRTKFLSSRSDQRKEAKSKRETVKQLRESLPTGTPEGKDVELAAAKARLAEIDPEKRHAEIKEQLTKAEVAALEACRNEKDRAESEYERKLREIEKERDEAIKEASEKANEFISSAKDAANREYRIHLNDTTAEREALSGTIATLESELKRFIVAEGTQETIMKLEGEAEKADRTARELEKQITALDELHTKVTSNLPIKGLSHANGIAYIDNVAVHRLNTEKRLALAMRIMTMRAEKRSKAKIIFCDGLECLDRPHREAFLEAAKKYVDKGYQFIMTRLMEEPTDLKLNVIE